MRHEMNEMQNQITEKFEHLKNDNCPVYKSYWPDFDLVTFTPMSNPRQSMNDITRNRQTKKTLPYQS